MASEWKDITMKPIRRIRNFFVPWYDEKDDRKSFARWLRETDEGRQGWTRLRNTIIRSMPEEARNLPERLPPID